MLQGNEGKSIFPEEEDYGKFLQILATKMNDIPKSQNKHHRDDVILNLKKESNLCIRKITEILGINRGIEKSKERGQVSTFGLCRVRSCNITRAMPY